MSAAVADRDAARKPGERVSLKQGAVKIYKGTGVSIRVADGYAYPARSGTATDKFAGVAFKQSDNSAGAAGAKEILVVRQGVYSFVKATPAQTDVGALFYFADDSTVTATATNNQLAGKCVGLDPNNSGSILIDIANAANL